MPNQFLRVVCLLIAVCFVLGYCTKASAQVPAGAHRYQHEYVRTVRSEWGLDAPVGALAAQIGAESQWNCRAVSRVGARGCAQFMPTTAVWIGEVDHSLREGDVYSPAWAFRAQAVYMKWLHDRVKGSGPCDRMAAALASYNQGLGWTYRAQKLAGTVQWLNGAERVNPGQSAAAFKESRAYPRRILGVLEPQYVRSGWVRGACA